MSHLFRSSVPTGNIRTKTFLVLLYVICSTILKTPHESVVNKAVTAGCILKGVL